MDERRSTHRDPIYLGGVVVSERWSAPPLDCLVRDMSTAGADIVFESSRGVPGEFQVTIPRTGERRCARIMWKDEEQAGVAFLHARRMMTASVDAALYVRKLAGDQRILADRIARITKCHRPC